MARLRRPLRRRHPVHRDHHRSGPAGGGPQRRPGRLLYPLAPARAADPRGAGRRPRRGPPPGAGDQAAAPPRKGASGDPLDFLLPRAGSDRVPRLPAGRAGVPPPPGAAQQPRMVRAAPRGLRDRGAGSAPEPGRGDGRPAGAGRSRDRGRPAALDLPHPPRRPLLGRQVAVQDQRRLPVLPPRRGPRRGTGRRGRGRRTLLPAGRRRVLRGGRHLDAGPAGAREDPRGAGGGPRGAGRDRPRARCSAAGSRPSTGRRC